MRTNKRDLQKFVTVYRQEIRAVISIHSDEGMQGLAEKARVHLGYPVDKDHGVIWKEVFEAYNKMIL